MCMRVNNISLQLFQLTHRHLYSNLIVNMRIYLNNISLVFIPILKMRK
jgi:hypothetical protein